MFNRLPESNAQRQRRPGVFVVSTVVHLVVIALAARASGLTAAPTPKIVADVLVYTTPNEPPPPKTVEPIVRRSLANPITPSLPAPLTIPPAISTEIPSTIPDPGVMQNLIESAFNPSRVSSGGGAAGSATADGAPFPANLVEKAVIAIPGTATPRYPSMLQSAGIEGNVRAQFVVDTLGRVEQGSFKALEATHDLFAAAVRDALGRARFKPAEVGGHRVRQLVEQTFTFSITTK